MRLATYLAIAMVLLSKTPTHAAAVVDRVAIVIDKKVITESEILDELRLTQFLNNQPLDLGPQARREAGERLVDQELIRRELEGTGFAKPSASEADALLRTFRQQRFPSVVDYRAALEKYGIAEDELKQRLLWQVTAIQFTDLRFRSQLAEADTQSADWTADRAAPAAAPASVDQQMEAWLKQARSNTKIAFKPEAFQ